MNLITGATGHIGNVLARELVNRGEQVRTLILPGEDLSPIEDLDLEIQYGNILDRSALSKAMKGVECVFHLAGIISITSGNQSLIQEVNVQGTKNVMECAMDAGVKKVIYTSSIHAFKRIPHGTTIDESTPIDPDSAIAAYDHSKAEATLLVLELVKKGLPAVITCPTGVIGPCDFKTSEMGGLFRDWLTHKVTFMIEGKYDFVDVRDVVQGLILARDKGKVGQLYILSGELIRISDLWNLAKELLSPQSKLLNIPTSLALIAASAAEKYYKITRSTPKFTRYSIETVNSNAVISNKKARYFLGYRPRSMTETVKDTVLWWKSRFSHAEIKKKN